MDRYPGDQFPYAAFFWPALAAASAGEIASSFAAHFLRTSGDAYGDRTPQEPEGATPSKIALELHSVRLRNFTTVKSGVPTLLCTPLALHGATLSGCSGTIACSGAPGRNAAGVSPPRGRAM